MPENDLSRDLRARSAKLISYPIDFLMRWRSIVKFLLHAGIFAFAYVTAYLLRFEFSLSPKYLEMIRYTIPLVLVSIHPKAYIRQLIEIVMLLGL